MPNYCEFVEVSLPNGSIVLVQVNDAHLDVFDILPKHAPDLRLADEVVREIASDEDGELDGTELANRMATLVPPEQLNLPFDQCIRWQLLRSTLSESQLITKHFGSTCWSQVPRKKKYK